MGLKEKELNRIEEENKIDTKKKEHIKMLRREDKIKMEGSKIDWDKLESFKIKMVIYIPD